MLMDKMAGYTRIITFHLEGPSRSWVLVVERATITRFGLNWKKLFLALVVNTLFLT